MTWFKERLPFIPSYPTARRRGANLAERERLTNKERRERARAERRRKEAEQAAKRERGRITSGLATFAVIGVVAAVLIQAFVGGTPSLDSAIVVAGEDIDPMTLAARSSPTPRRCVTAAASSRISEFATTYNLEHGHEHRGPAVPEVRIGELVTPPCSTSTGTTTRGHAGGGLPHDPPPPARATGLTFNAEILHPAGRANIRNHRQRPGAPL